MKKDKNKTLTPMSGQEAFDAIADHLLGKDYYIVDPVCTAQGNAIIVDEIKSTFMSMDQKRHISKTILKYLLYALTALCGFGFGCLLCNFI